MWTFQLYKVKSVAPKWPIVIVMIIVQKACVFVYACVSGGVGGVMGVVMISYPTVEQLLTGIMSD